MTRYFILNTDRSNSPDGTNETLILDHQIAFLFEKREKYDKEHYHLKEGDIVFIYGNEAPNDRPHGGLIAYGKVRGPKVHNDEMVGYLLKEFTQFDTPITALRFKEITGHDISVTKSQAIFETQEFAGKKLVDFLES